MNWKLTQAAVGEPRIDHWSDEDREEDLAVGYTLMRAMAAEYQLEEIGPGIWRHSAEGVTWIPKDSPGWDL